MIIEPKTQRLILRQWQDKDYVPFAQLNSSAEVMTYFPSLLTREASNAMANKCRKLITEKGWGLWAVELKDTGAFIGFVGLHTPIADLPFNPCVEVGWRLARSYWGMGYATEAALAALEVAFIQLKLDEVVSFTALQNDRSQAVMKRLGMRYDGEFEHPALALDSPLRKHCLYRLSFAQWTDKFSLR